MPYRRMKLTTEFRCDLCPRIRIERNNKNWHERKLPTLRAKEAGWHITKQNEMDWAVYCPDCAPAVGDYSVWSGQEWPR
jgi:hypothetical protein